MKKIIITFIMMALLAPAAMAQSSVTNQDGTCGPNTKWLFDGYLLTITVGDRPDIVPEIENYDLQERKAPWVKKKLNVRKVVIGRGISQIGSCAFANCTSLQEVVFEGTNLRKIGWGAFLNCTRLRNISLPIQLKSIGTIAFANCSQIPSIKIPDQCRVDNQAFVSCTNLQSIELSPTANLGHMVFASEVTIDGRIRHALYDKEITRLPSYINMGNCKEYGFARSSVEKLLNQRKASHLEDYDYLTSDLDKDIPSITYARNNTYALIIGNQNYRFAANVPYAIHDARIFAEYCKKTLGIPAENIHISEDATKLMIMEDELEDWISNIPERENKKLIVYYAGHGVPDVKNKNKAYILPTDVHGTNPKRGIALDEFYNRLGELAFNQTSVFLDACFSGVNRDNEGVTEGLREVELMAEETEVNTGSVVVFSAAQGNETAQGYTDQGHGLFTYYLLKEIHDSYGTVPFGTMADNISKNVSKKALELKLRKKQTPVANPSESIADSWRNMQF
jgi:hypothetical protein